MKLRATAILIMLAALMLSLIYLGIIYNVPQTELGGSSITSSSKAAPPSRISSVSGEVSKFLEVGELYENLGYPRISWDPEEPNYTVSYQSFHNSPIYYDIGYLKMPVIDLQRALEIALRAVNVTPIGYFKMSMKAANITPQNYKLVSAYFSPGRVINGSLIIEPTWSLNFVRSSRDTGSGEALETTRTSM